MLWWFVDNVRVFQFLLGIIALGYGAAYYLTKRVKFLALAGLMIGGIALLWLLPRVIITDQKRLELNVREMADAVGNANVEALLSHLAEDFEFQGLQRADLARAAVEAAKRGDVNPIKISGWEVEKLDRTDRRAQVFFRATGAGNSFFCACRAQFILEGDHWKLQRIDIHNAVVDQNVPIQIPLR